MTDSPSVKACCAAAYSSDLVSLLLGDSYHPGGLALTRELVEKTGIAPTESVLDVAMGRGASALLIAGDYGARVLGVDLSDRNVRLAWGAAESARLGDLVDFRVGDAESLPVLDENVDVVLCECALCTFPDKSRAATEFFRVLRPGGRVGITDVTVDSARLPTELSTLGAWIACVADARPASGYAALLSNAGFEVTVMDRHDHALGRMIDQIEARLQLLRITAPERLQGSGVDLSRSAHLLDLARNAVRQGVIGYALIVARKPGPRPHQTIVVDGSEGRLRSQP